MPIRIRKLEDRVTGEVRFCLDRGEPQLLGPWYDTRDDAERARAAALMGRKGGAVASAAQKAAARENGKRGGRPRQG